MKKILIAILVGLVFFCHAQNYQWAKAIGGTVTSVNGQNSGQAITIDAAGNIYITGSFIGGGVDFNPGSTPLILNAGVTTTAGPAAQIFLAKYSPSGNCVWARAIISIDATGRGRDIAVDGLGNVYITGVFWGSADFDPGPGTATLVASGGDIFLAKYDAAGNYIWALNVGGSSTDLSQALDLDTGGNVYISGYFQSSVVDFDPSPSVSNLSASGSMSTFFAKYSINGAYLWARTFSGAGTHQSRSISVDGNSNVYICGSFQGAAIDFDPGASTSTLSSVASDVYFAKYDSNGNYLWARSIGTVTSAQAAAIDVHGPGVYLTGIFNGTAVDFDPGPGTVLLSSTATAASDMFFAKYDQAGNYIWVKSIPDASGAPMSRGSGGEIYISAGFNTLVDFDPGPGTATFNPVSVSDAFFGKYSSSGNFIWGRSIAGTTTLSANPGAGVAVDNLNNIYLTGFFRDTVDFDPGPGTATLTAGYSQFIYLAKYDYCKAQFNTSVTACASSGYSINGNIYTTNGTYTDTLHTSSGCDSIVVTQLTLSSQMPTVTIGSGSLLCQGFSNTLTAGGAQTYTWSTGPQTNSILVTPLNVTQYVVTGTGTNACTATASINVLPSPTISIIGNQTICKGNSVVLTAGTALSYSWNTGAQTPSITASPSAATVYTVTASVSGNSCLARQTFTVGVSNCLYLGSNHSMGGKIKIFPNPAKTEINYRVSGQHHYSIMDSQGIVVESGEQNGPLVRIDVSEFSPGIYYLTVSMLKNSWTAKFIKE